MTVLTRDRLLDIRSVFEQTVAMSQSADGPRAELTRVAQLFEQELGDVTFPGVDHQAFDDARREHAAAEAELAEAEELVQRAEQALRAQQTAVASLVERALAYLRVYAADDAELLAKLDELTPKRRGPKKGRRRKARPKAEDEVAADAELDVARAS